MSEQPTSLFTSGGTGPSLFDDAEPTPTRTARRPLVWNAGTDLGLLLLRVGIGATFLGHGLQKVFGLFGGPGIPAFSQFLGSVGFTQTTTLAWLTGVGELVAGAFVIVGLLTPLASAGLLAIMINVVLLKLGSGFFTSPAGGGFELEAVLGLAAAALTLTGPGRIALDNGRAWHRRPASWGVLALVIGIAAAVLIRVLLHVDPPPPPVSGIGG